MEFAADDWMVRVGLMEKLTFQQRPEERKAKTPKVRTSLLCSRDIK